MIGTIAITITGTTAKTAPTAVTWESSAGLTVNTTGNTTGRSGNTGIGATVIRIAIKSTRKFDVSGAAPSARESNFMKIETSRFTDSR